MVELHLYPAVWRVGAGQLITPPATEQHFTPALCRGAYGQLARPPQTDQFYTWVRWPLTLWLGESVNLWPGGSVNRFSKKQIKHSLIQTLQQIIVGHILNHCACPTPKVQSSYCIVPHQTKHNGQRTTPNGVWYAVNPLKIFFYET